MKEFWRNLLNEVCTKAARSFRFEPPRFTIVANKQR
jgi:hypothetical protein